MTASRKFSLSGRIFETAEGMTLSIEEFFDFAKEKKCASVELRHRQINPWSSDEEIEKINELSTEYSLPVEMIKMRKGKLNEEKDYDVFLQYLALARKLNCRQMKIGGNNLDLLRRAAEEAKKTGTIVGTNNHIGTPLETKQGTLDYLHEIDHPDFKLLFDPSHLWINGDSADCEFIEKIADRISYVVVQDYVEGSGDGFEGIAKKTARGTTEDELGDVGYPEIMKAMDKLNCNIPYGLVQPGALYFLK